jgi:hypothetical protein
VSRNVKLQMLTGTPVNTPIDAYSYIKLLKPNAYRSLAHFTGVHVSEVDFFKKPLKFENLDLIREHLAERSISRTKEELHGYNLTPLFPDSEYELAEEHQALYNKLVEEQLLSFSDGFVIDATTVQKLRHALQQIVVNFDYFSNNPNNKSAAYELIDQTIEETQCANPAFSKLIIWTKYKRTSRSVLGYLNSVLKIPTVAAYSEADTERSINMFMDDPKTRVLVANYQSAGAGLNPQHVCWEALFLELDTVSLYIRQSIGRLDRQGQKHVPRMKFAIASNTVQVGLYEDLLRNDDLVQKVEPSKQAIREMLLGQSKRSGKILTTQSQGSKIL